MSMPILQPKRSFFSQSPSRIGVTRGKDSKKYKGGFTLAELIVVIAIFAVITSIALFDQAKLNSSILLTNLSYEVGLSVREAQTYGIGVRSPDDGSDPDAGFSGLFGVHFDLTNTGANNQIILYSGTSDSNIYLSPDQAKYMYTFTNQRGNYIRALCLGPGFGQGTPCTGNVAKLDVWFQRPSPDAHFHGTDASGNTDDSLNIGPAYIVVSSQDNTNCKVIVIQQTGQVSVENATDHGLCTTSS